MEVITIKLDVTEHEASVITGSLMEFGDNWPDEDETANTLRDFIRAQLPREWVTG